MITIFAFITMLIDHIGYIFFPNYEIFRIIGRIAFPLFAFFIVRGYFFTKNKLNYIKRLLILAIGCQIPFGIVFGFGYYNVIFTLLFGLLSIMILGDIKIRWFFKIFFIGILLTISYFFNFDYNIYGILTIILIYIFWEQKKIIFYFTILTILFYNIDYSNFIFVYHYQIFASIAFIILYFTPILKYDFKINFYFKYLFYPFHLVFLYLLYLFLRLH